MDDLDFVVPLGKSYWRVNLLIEIDHDTGTSRTVDYASYPAKQNDWLLARKKQKSIPKPKPKKDMIKDKIQEITDEQVLF